MADADARMEGPAGTVSWHRHGDGPALILINGYAATGLDWDPNFVAALARTRTVICPDNRGMGDSELGGETPTMAAMAADIVALLDRLQLETAPVVGWSMGGFIAQMVAAIAPDRVSELVLLSTDPGGPDAVRGSSDTWADLTDQSGSPREQAVRLLSLLFPEPVASGLGEDVIEIVASARAGLSPEALDAQDAALGRWYGPEGGAGDLGEIPILAAAGSLDIVIPSVNAATLARSDHDWLARFPGCGHAFMAQQPRRLAGLIEAFLTAR